MNFLTGRWKNAAGSIISFEASQNGQLKGTYITQIGNAPLIAHPLSGSWSNVHEGAFLSFMITWTSHLLGAKRSTTAWTGKLYLDRCPPEIVASWTQTSVKPENKDWKSVAVNQDVFKKESEEPK